MSKSKFTTVSASKRLMHSMEIAIDNMIEEIKKPVDPEIKMVKDLEISGNIKDVKDYSGGFAERFSK